MKTFIASFTLVFFLLSAQAQTSCSSCSTSNCSSVSVTYTANGSKLPIKNVPWVQGMNVTVAMSNAQSVYYYTYTTKTFCPFGAALTSVNGLYPGAGQFWQLSINGTVAGFGMDFQKVNAGDSVEWNLVNYSSPKPQAGTAVRKKVDGSAGHLTHQDHLAHLLLGLSFD